MSPRRVSDEITVLDSGCLCCSVLGDLVPRVSPPGEIVLRSEFYDYAAKYEEEGMTLVVPARIGEGAAAEVAAIATEAFARAGIRPEARAEELTVEQWGRLAQ